MEAALLNTLTKAIRKKASWVSRHYPRLNYTDLVQDGLLLVLQLHKQKSPVSIAYFLKAVNNKYSNLIRTARRDARRTTQLSTDAEIECPRSTNNISQIEEDLDWERFRARLRNPVLVSIFDSLNNGLSVKDIARQQHRSTRHVYRLINRMSHLRHKWETSQKENYGN